MVCEGTRVPEPRRSAGFLRNAILRLLADAGRPVSGIELRAMLSREAFPVPQSLVFREVRKLIDRGAIRKIWTAKGYMLFDGTPRIALFCGQCGQTTETVCEGAFAALNRLAAAGEFTVSGHVVELVGTCSECRHLSAAPSKVE